MLPVRSRTDGCGVMERREFLRRVAVVSGVAATARMAGLDLGEAFAATPPWTPRSSVLRAHPNLGSASPGHGEGARVARTPSQVARLAQRAVFFLDTFLREIFFWLIRAADLSSTAVLDLPVGSFGVTFFSAISASPSGPPRAPRPWFEPRTEARKGEVSGVTDQGCSPSHAGW